MSRPAARAALPRTGPGSLAPQERGMKCPSGQNECALCIRHTGLRSRRWRVRPAAAARRAPCARSLRVRCRAAAGAPGEAGPVGRLRHSGTALIPDPMLGRFRWVARRGLRPRFCEKERRGTPTLRDCSDGLLQSQCALFDWGCPVNRSSLVVPQSCHLWSCERLSTTAVTFVLRTQCAATGMAE